MVFILQQGTGSNIIDSTHPYQSLIAKDSLWNSNFTLSSQKKVQGRWLLYKREPTFQWTAAFLPPFDIRCDVCHSSLFVSSCDPAIRLGDGNSREKVDNALVQEPRYRYFADSNFKWFFLE